MIIDSCKINGHTLRRYMLSADTDMHSEGGRMEKKPSFLERRDISTVH